MCNLEQQVKGTSDLAEKSIKLKIQIKSQIQKSQLALQEVNKAVSLIGKKFDAYQQERRETNEIFNRTVSNMNEKVEELESKIDHHEQ